VTYSYILAVLVGTWRAVVLAGVLDKNPRTGRIQLFFVRTVRVLRRWGLSFGLAGVETMVYGMFVEVLRLNSSLHLFLLSTLAPHTNRGIVGSRDQEPDEEDYQSPQELPPLPTSEVCQI